jgi:predicted DNA-binding transcriptional regulator AlpA
VIADLRQALRALALSNPPGAAVTFTVPRDELLMLLDTNGNGHEPAPTSAPSGTADRLLKAPEAAAVLGVSTRYLYHHRRDYPFTKTLPGGTVRFSERGLTRFLGRI